MAKYTYDFLYDLYYVQDISVRRISELLKISTHTLRREFIELGISIKKRKATLQDQISKEILQDLYETQLKSTGEIGDMFGVNMSSVNYLLHKYEIKARPAHEAIRGYYDKYPNVNIRFFESMSPQLAFYLGLMYSDGYIDDRNNVGIGLQDLELIQWIRNVIDCKSSILQSLQPNGNIFYTLKFMNEKVCKLLINKYNLLPRKSKSIIFPDFIPEQYIPYFVRGVFEGDGTVGEYNFKDNNKDRTNYSAAIYCGSNTFLVKIKEIIEGIIPGNRKISDANKVGGYRIHGIRNVCKFGEWLYQGSIFVESRKLKIFRSIGAAVIPEMINSFNAVELLNKQLKYIIEELNYIKLKAEQNISGCNEVKKVRLYNKMIELEKKFCLQMNSLSILLNEIINKGKN